MSTISNPERAFNRASIPAIERQTFNGRRSIEGGANIASSALDVTISSERNWQLDTIEFGFSDASRDYDVNIVAGRKIVTHYNDYLWFEIDGITAQRIILDAGFYNGTELAAELEAQLDANTAFAAASITFTVAYASPSFTITPSSGTIRYIDRNNTQVGNIRQSIAGPLFGLTATSSLAASVTSDTPVAGLGNSISEIVNVGNSATNYLLVTDDASGNRGPYTMDQALVLSSNTAPTDLTYKVNYTEIL